VGEEFEEAIIIADGVIEEMDGVGRIPDPNDQEPDCEAQTTHRSENGALVERAHAVVCAQVLDIVERTRDFLVALVRRNCCSAFAGCGD